jgi:hypothetical protein
LIKRVVEPDPHELLAILGKKLVELGQGEDIARLRIFAEALRIGQDIVLNESRAFRLLALGEIEDEVPPLPGGLRSDERSIVANSLCRIPLSAGFDSSAVSIAATVSSRSNSTVSSSE